MGTDRTSAGDELARLVTELRRAYDEARALIASDPDPHRAFKLATQFAAELRTLADHGADLRAIAVGRIWDSEATSLARLAEKISVSKARAGQLLQNARELQQRSLSEEET